MIKVLGKIIKQPLGAIGLFIILSWIAIAIFAPLLAPPAEVQDPYMILCHTFSSLPTPPDEVAKFGITEGGYDIYYGIIWGSRTALLVGLITVFFNSVIGVLVGGISAYYGGIVDNLIMWIVDLFMSIPSFPAVVVDGRRIVNIRGKMRTQNGINGNPTFATKEKGDLFLEKAVDIIVDFLKEYKEMEVK